MVHICIWEVNSFQLEWSPFEKRGKQFQLKGLFFEIHQAHNEHFCMEAWENQIQRSCAMFLS